MSIDSYVADYGHPLWSHPYSVPQLLGLEYSEKALGLQCHVRAQCGYFGLTSFSQDWNMWVFLNGSRVKRNAWCFGKAGAGTCSQEP